MRKLCIPSPVLFKNRNIDKNRNIEIAEVVRRGQKSVIHIGHADDLTLIAEAENAQQTALSVVAEESKAKGLELNTGKTEYRAKINFIT